VNLTGVAGVVTSADAVLYRVNVGGEIGPIPFDPIGTEQPLTPPVYVYLANAAVLTSTHIVQTVSLVGLAAMAATPAATPFLFQIPG